VLEFAVDEARRLKHHYVGTEHLLLGLIREGEGIAAGVLESLGVSLERVRVQTIRVLKDYHPASAGESAATPKSAEGRFAAEQIRTMLDYSIWARDRLLTVIETLDEAALRKVPEGGAYGSIHDTLAHMAVSEWMWLQRCQGRSPERLPKGEDFASQRVLIDWWNEQHAHATEYVQVLDDADLQGEVTYRGPDGKERTRKVWHMLMQVVNHQTEHRGQLASYLGQLGHEVPQIDLVVYLSEKS
jgi:uncharacterized damage-inducible protein DinB